MGPETNSQVPDSSCLIITKAAQLTVTIGTDADSNILKIYRMLDRNNGHDKHYYQVSIVVQSFARIN